MNFMQPNDIYILKYFKKILNIPHNGEIPEDYDKIFELIHKNEKLIYDEILHNHVVKIGTKRNYFSLLSKIFNYIGDKKLHKKYGSLINNINSNIIKLYQQNKYLETRINNKYNKFSNLIEKLKELKIIYEADKTNRKNNLLYLQLALYTLQPPIRGEWKNILNVFDNNQFDFTKLNKDKINFLFLGKKGFLLRINKDKISNRKGPIFIPISKNLENIIKDSIRNYPRKYVLTTPNFPNIPLTKIRFERNFYNIFKPEKVGIDILRSAYITHIFNNDNNNLSIASKIQLANFMRTSLDSIQLYYNKTEI
jgi:hypothetical protein